MLEMKLPPKPKEDVDDLKARVQAMSRFYFKGMGTACSTVISWAGNRVLYLHAKEDAEKAKEVALDRLAKIKARHASIPFEKLWGDADYYALFAARNALKMCEAKLMETLAEDDLEASEKLNAELEGIFTIFTRWGKVYGARINGLLKRIHAAERKEEFGFEMIDIDGKSWGWKTHIGL